MAVAKDDTQKIFHMIGWQIAAGVLFLAFGLELAFSNTILHALEPFEHGKGPFDLGLEGLASNVLLVVGALNLGVATWRFSKVIQNIADKLDKH